MGGDGFQTQRMKSWVPGQIRAEKVLADAITIDGRKEWICKFCSETNVWTHWLCRGNFSNILLFCRENTSRLSLRRTKDGIQDHLPRVVENRESLVIMKRRSRSCVHKWGCSASSKECGRARRRRESRREEEDTDCKKKLDDQKESLQKELRDIEKFTDMEPMVRDSQKEKWKCQLQEIERKRTELLQEHQKMQKVSEVAEFAGQEEELYQRGLCW